ncbi:hypothetical protein [Catenulispora rubra]|nr:hypothetical protein [Catenulispora rubra]
MITVLPRQYDGDDFGRFAGGLYRNEARCDMDRAQDRHTIEEGV